MKSILTAKIYARDAGALWVFWLALFRLKSANYLLRVRLVTLKLSFKFYKIRLEFIVGYLVFRERIRFWIHKLCFRTRFVSGSFAPTGT